MTSHERDSYTYISHSFRIDRSTFVPILHWLVGIILMFFQCQSIWIFFCHMVTCISIMQSFTKQSEEFKQSPRKCSNKPNESATKVDDGNELKQHASAPFYLYSLKENESPPFRRPAPETSPKLLIGTFLNEAEAIELIASGTRDISIKSYFAKQLISKNVIANYELSERKFLVGLLTEATDYAAQHEFDARKLACLLTIYINTHMYFKWYYWTSPTAIWAYFKELMVRHTIEDSPHGEEVFDPAECFDILSHFHTIYINNLPLIHILTFGVTKLKFTWPFKP